MRALQDARLGLPGTAHLHAQKGDPTSLLLHPDPVIKRWLKSKGYKSNAIAEMFKRRITRLESGPTVNYKFWKRIL